MITMRFNPPNVRLINFGNVGKKNAHINDAILNNDQTNINILVNVFITFSFIKKCSGGLTKKGEDYLPSPSATNLDLICSSSSLCLLEYK